MTYLDLLEKLLTMEVNSLMSPVLIWDTDEMKYMEANFFIDTKGATKHPLGNNANYITATHIKVKGLKKYFKGGLNGNKE